MIVAVSGHRPPKLGGYWVPNPVYDAVKAGLLRKFWDLQPTVVLTGMALGTDQWAAEVCLENNIPYDAIVPFHGFESQWPDGSRAQYRRLLSEARSIHVVTDSAQYSPGLLQRRNQWLVDHSALLLGVWNGSSGGTANCINYARHQQKNIVLVDLPHDIWVRAAEVESQQHARQDSRGLYVGPSTDRVSRLHRRHANTNPQPAPTSTEGVAATMNAIAIALQDPAIRNNLLANIGGDSPPHDPPTPSPLKEDYTKATKPFTTGRVIDLDD